jgi:Tetratricopeptide repeat
VAVGQLAVPRAELAGQPVRLAVRPPPLAGREELLAELDARLSAGDSRAPRTVVLCGLGGVGKTSVAVEYAHRHLGEVGVAWQFAAEDAAVLAAGFGELAAQLGARELIDVRDPVASVHGVLAAYPREWLLIFDNAPDRPSVASFLPPAGRGRVLVPSQNQNWPPGQAVDVPVLNIEVAADFLVNRTGDPDEQAAASLAEELGGLPLALEQAAAYMQATGVQVAVYLATLRQRRADLLARGEATGYSKTVATTWALAFDRLEHAEPEAVGLLRLLACYAPEAVPLRLLFQPRPGLAEQLAVAVAPVLVPLLDDPLAASDAIAALRRYSLVSPPADGSVSVHRLVQAVTLGQMSEDLAGAWRQAAAALVEAALPEDATQPGTWPVYALLLPHAQATLVADSDGMRRIASYLGFSGSHTAARDLCHRVLEARVQVSGPEHPSTLFDRGHLAFWTGQAGDAAGARDQFAALVPVIEPLTGPEHEGLLLARGNLAHWTGEAGDAAGARDQFAALLPVVERVCGPEHSGTLVARGDLARWTGQAGDAVGARDQFAALLPVTERVGPEHPYTLAIRANLARWTGETGDAAGARDQFAALLPVVELVCGPEHPDTLADRANLARWTGEAGDAAGARDQFAALLPVRERVSGPAHRATLNTRANLAYWTGQATSGPGPTWIS